MTQPFRARMRGAIDGSALAMEHPGPHSLIDAVAADLTHAHAAAVAAVLGGRRRRTSSASTARRLAHRPERGWTWQAGDGQMLATPDATRPWSPTSARPMSPPVATARRWLRAYHRAHVHALSRNPSAVLNLGGVGNITWFGADETPGVRSTPARATR